MGGEVVGVVIVVDCVIGVVEVIEVEGLCYCSVLGLVDLGLD